MECMHIYIWTSLLIFSEPLGEGIKELKDSKLAYIQIMSSNKILHPRISSEDFFKQHVDVKLELIPPSCGLSTMYDTHKLQYEVKSPPRDLSEPQWYQNSGFFFSSFTDYCLHYIYKKKNKEVLFSLYYWWTLNQNPSLSLSTICKMLGARVFSGLKN